MSSNLREQVESDLAISLEGDWALPVELTAPDGVVVPTPGGQILYDTVRVNPDTGEEMVVNNPIVVLRRSSLSRVPQPGEIWAVRIPLTPSTTATLADFVIDPTRPPEGGSSVGFIRLYLRKAKQS